MFQRYGAPSRTRRRTVLVVSGLVGAVALAWVVWAAWFQSNPQVQSALVSFDVVDQHAVTARVSVQPSSRSVSASCKLRAYAEDHSVVGERNFRVRDASGTVRLTVPFRTERGATSVEMIGCTAAGQSRPR